MTNALKLVFPYFIFCFIYCSWQKAGVTLKVDGKLPSLVNLNEDPQLSEVLLYVLRQGSTRVGQLKDDSSNEIQLSGPLISEDHW